MSSQNDHDSVQMLWCCAGKVLGIPTCGPQVQASLTQTQSSLLLLFRMPALLPSKVSVKVLAPMTVLGHANAA